MKVIWFLLVPLAYARLLDPLENNHLQNTCGREMVPFMKAPIYNVALGNHVMPNHYPFVVAVALRHPKRPQCSGVLISKRHVLTAAHCVVGVEDMETYNQTCRTKGGRWVRRLYYAKEDFIIYAGSRCPHPGPCRPKRIEHRVIRISVHPQFDICLKFNDLAVMELSHDVDPREAIPICTPSANTPLPRELQVVGYGIDPFDIHSKSYPRLQVASLLDRREANGFIISSNGPRNACEGDSGGSLFCKSNGRFTLLGITSCGSVKCSEVEFATREVYYVDVRKQLHWICKISGVCLMV